MRIYLCCAYKNYEKYIWKQKDIDDLSHFMYKTVISKGKKLIKLTLQTLYGF